MITGAVGSIEVVEVPTPVPGAKDVLVRVRAGGICGTDGMFPRLGGVPFGAGGAMVPLPLGHEPAGAVVAIGPDVDAQGADPDRVAAPSTEGRRRVENLASQVPIAESSHCGCTPRPLGPVVTVVALGSGGLVRAAGMAGVMRTIRRLILECGPVAGHMSRRVGTAGSAPPAEEDV